MKLEDIARLAHTDGLSSRFLEDVSLIRGISEPLRAHELASPDPDALSDRYTRHQPMPVTGVILCRNDEETIGRCVESLSQDVDSILLIDSGSSDRTIDEAVAAFPAAKVVHLPWVDDFSHHRNAALDHIAHGWVVYVDSDEFLLPSARGRLRRGLSAVEYLLPDIDIAACQHILDVEGTDYGYIQRILRADTAMRFRGRIHERPYDAAGNSPDTIQIDCSFHHTGYVPSFREKRGKAARNRRVHALCRGEEPDNPKWVFYTVREELASVRSPEDARSLFRLLESAVEACPDDAPDYLAERLHDSWVLLCQLAVAFGGGNDLRKYSTLLRNVGRQVHGAYFHAILESSRALGVLSGLVDLISETARHETPDTRHLVGELLELQASLALASGRHEMVSPALSGATARGAGCGTHEDLGRLRELLDQLEAADTTPLSSLP
ncbi:glycosyltransferase [Streptantibioticus parmotrematis]|uniref:glycosyltransferase n=1 Tax=Streptantibioticus parmotrematis TaxID=2873249 RepID=UPI0033DCE3B7